MDIEIYAQQREFIDATADEVLYGGAAGGGKSYGQILDAFIKALKYPGIKQLIFRRTYPELEKSIIRTTMELYPSKVCKYNTASHTMRFVNGSIIDYAYLDSDNDVTKYQSAEYDIIRFDELTHFTEYMYTYMISRVRGANNFPKQLKSSTNPGHVGHKWVKERFIDIGEWHEQIETPTGTRLFIPALVTDNVFLMRQDPAYIKRLENLSPEEYRMLRYGDWDVFEGQYFNEFRREIHTCEPFPIPTYWTRYRAFDYGLDMLACLWAAFDQRNNCYIYRELCEPNLVISEAARKIRELTVEDVRCTYAPADMWGRNRDSGKAQADLFAEYGLPLVRVRNGRVDGWLNLKEWLHPVDDGTGEKKPRLHIFTTCKELIRCLPMLQHDDKEPSDCATEPHDITHAPDALRYLMDGRPRPADTPIPKDDDRPELDDQIDNFMDYGR